MHCQCNIGNYFPANHSLPSGELPGISFTGLVSQAKVTPLDPRQACFNNERISIIHY